MKETTTNGVELNSKPTSVTSSVNRLYAEVNVGKDQPPIDPEGIPKGFPGNIPIAKLELNRGPSTQELVEQLLERITSLEQRVEELECGAFPLEKITRDKGTFCLGCGRYDLIPGQNPCTLMEDDPMEKIEELFKDHPRKAEILAYYRELKEDLEDV